MYSPEAKALFHTWIKTVPIPGFEVMIDDVTEDWLIVLLSRKNFESYSAEDRQRLAHYISEFMRNLNLITPAILEVIDDKP